MLSTTTRRLWGGAERRVDSSATAVDFPEPWGPEMPRTKGRGDWGVDRSGRRKRVISDMTVFSGGGGGEGVLGAAVTAGGTLVMVGSRLDDEDGEAGGNGYSCDDDASSFVESCCSGMSNEGSYGWGCGAEL